MKNKEKLNSYIDHERDYSFDYFGFKTLERAYLTKVNGRIVERLNICGCELLSEFMTMILKMLSKRMI